MNSTSLSGSASVERFCEVLKLVPVLAETRATAKRAGSRKLSISRVIITEEVLYSKTKYSFDEQYYETGEINAHIHEGRDDSSGVGLATYSSATWMISSCVGLTPPYYVQKIRLVETYRLYNELTRNVKMLAVFVATITLLKVCLSMRRFFF